LEVSRFQRRGGKPLSWKGKVPQVEKGLLPRRGPGAGRPPSSEPRQSCKTLAKRPSRRAHSDSNTTKGSDAIEISLRKGRLGRGKGEGKKDWRSGGIEQAVPWEEPFRAEKRKGPLNMQNLQIHSHISKNIKRETRDGEGREFDWGKALFWGQGEGLRSKDAHTRI